MALSAPRSVAVSSLGDVFLSICLRKQCCAIRKARWSQRCAVLEGGLNPILPSSFFDPEEEEKNRRKRIEGKPTDNTINPYLHCRHASVHAHANTANNALTHTHRRADVNTILIIIR